MQRYEIELWSRNGVFIADVSPYVKNLNFSMQRNEAEQLSFNIDLNAYEDFSESIGTNPTSILGPYQTDVKIKRDGEYLFGAHVGYLDVNMGETTMTINVRAFGYLNLLIDRYITKSYYEVDAVDIAWDLINETQLQTNGDLDMTLGLNQTTTVLRERNYERQNVKEAIVNLTDLITGNFDFRFTADREFETFDMIGSDQSEELEFIYPGNIKEVTVPRDGLALFNKIYGIGSGFGEEAITSTQSDNDSQLNYGVHEDIALFNSVSIQETLDENTLGILERKKSLLEIPQMTVNGTDFDLNMYGIGDRVTARIEQHPFLATVTGIYRIERLEVDVDENEAETIKIFFDNYKVVQ